MPKERWLKAKLEIDYTGGSSYVEQPLMMQLQGTNRRLAQIESTALGETYEDMTNGIEESDEIGLEQFVKHGNAEFDKMAAAFDAEDIIAVKLLHEDGNEETYTAQVIRLESRAGGVQDVQVRAITLRRVSAVSIGVPP